MKLSRRSFMKANAVAAAAAAAGLSDSICFFLHVTRL